MKLEIIEQALSLFQKNELFLLEDEQLEALVKALTYHYHKGYETFVIFHENGRSIMVTHQAIHAILLEYNRRSASTQ